MSFEKFFNLFERGVTALESIAESNKQMLGNIRNPEAIEAQADLAATPEPCAVSGKMAEQATDPTPAPQAAPSAVPEPAASVPEPSIPAVLTGNDDPMPEWNPLNEEAQSRYAGNKPAKLDWCLNKLGVNDIPTRWTGKVKHEKIIEMSKQAPAAPIEQVEPPKPPVQQRAEQTPPPPAQETPAAPAAPAPAQTEPTASAGVDLDPARQVLQQMMQAGHADQAFSIMRANGCPDGPKGIPMLTVEGQPVISQDQVASIVNQCNALMGQGIG